MYSPEQSSHIRKKNNKKFRVSKCWLQRKTEELCRCMEGSSVGNGGDYWDSFMLKGRTEALNFSLSFLPAFDFSACCSHVPMPFASVAFLLFFLLLLWPCSKFQTHGCRMAEAVWLPLSGCHGSLLPRYGSQTACVRARTHGQIILVDSWISSVFFKLLWSVLKWNSLVIQSWPEWVSKNWNMMVNWLQASRNSACAAVCEKQCSLTSLRTCDKAEKRPFNTGLRTSRHTAKGESLLHNTEN